MAGTFPTTFFNTIEFKSNTNTRVTTSISGRTQRASVAGQFFSFKMTSIPLSLSDFKTVNAFINNQHGRLESFTITPPVIASTSGTATGTVTVVDDSSIDPAYNITAGSTAIPVSGGTGTLKAGDFIKFSNHNKVYQLTADTDLDGSTIDTINIFPALTTAVTGSTTVTYNDVPFRVFLNSDQSTFATNVEGFYRYEIEVREEL